MPFVDVLLSVLAIIGIIVVGGFLIYLLGGLMLAILDPKNNNISVKSNKEIKAEKEAFEYKSQEVLPEITDIKTNENEKNKSVKKSDNSPVLIDWDEQKAKEEFELINSENNNIESTTKEIKSEEPKSISIDDIFFEDEKSNTDAESAENSDDEDIDELINKILAEEKSDNSSQEEDEQEVQDEQEDENFGDVELDEVNSEDEAENIEIVDNQDDDLINNINIEDLSNDEFEQSDVSDSEKDKIKELEDLLEKQKAEYENIIEQLKEENERRISKLSNDNNDDEKNELQKRIAELEKLNEEKIEELKKKNEELLLKAQEEQAKIDVEKVTPLLSLEEYEQKLLILEERLKDNEKNLKSTKKEYVPLAKVKKSLEAGQKKLRRKEALVARQKEVLYGVNNYVDIDEEKAKKLAEDLDLLDGLRLSVQHCEEVMRNNKERYPILENTYNILLENNENIKADIDEVKANIEKLKKNN